jgi:hypothetical protein
MFKVLGNTGTPQDLGIKEVTRSLEGSESELFFNSLDT